jgi:post-segregation antitoxin (ccd killing protein)
MAYILSVSVPQGIVTRARELHINLSQACRRGLEQEILKVEGLTEKKIVR